MDRITKNLLADFINQNGITTGGESENFESFVNYTVVSSEYNESFSYEDISTAKNQGYDGIAIIVNNKLVTTEDELDDLIEFNKYLDVNFIFIQSKTSDKFEGSEIGNLFFSIKDFFDSEPKLVTTEEAQNYLDITNRIFNNSHFMTRGKPSCKIFYVTTGKWNEEEPLKAVAQNGVKELSDMNLFKNVLFVPCDASRLQDLYARSKEVENATFNFKDKITLQDIEGIKEVYLGILPFSELKKIVLDENGNIRSIFYDNVRVFLGNNPVNSKIEETLTAGKFDLFAVLNNGLTIVADNIISTGNKFKISNYQIVNGCQTSHIIFNNKELEGIDLLNVPIRLIGTDNDDIKNQITIATNNQTEVKLEQLEALSNFQKKLEYYYSTYDGDDRLYYERLTNQYSTSVSTPKSKIITIPIQIKVFSAMFLNKPELVSGYYGKVAKSLGENIFKNDHELAPYYLSGLAYYKLEGLFKNGSIDKKYKKARYHILMLFRIMYAGYRHPLLNSKRIENYCNVLLSILNNSSNTLDSFKKVIEILDRSGIDISNQKLLYQKSNTDLLIRLCNINLNKIMLDVASLIEIIKK